MTNRFENWSSSLRRMFVKDHGIPMSVVQDPYFEYQMDFFDRQYKTLEKADLLDKALENFDNEDEFRKEMRSLRCTMIDHVKGHPQYEDFCNFEKFQFTQTIPDRSMYKTEFCDQDLISFDLISANFQAFRFVFPALMDDKKTYKEFAQQFTDDEYFLQSKQLRQIIFGNLNPKRQQHIQRSIMSRIASHLVSTGTSLLSSSSDEIILSSDLDFSWFIERADDIRSFAELHVEQFVIEKIPTKTSSIFIKRFPDDTFKLKCCPAPYTLEVLKHIYQEESHPYDKIFFNDGRICEYKDSLFE